MIPASKAEKFVSMLLMTLIVIPVLFFVVYFAIDGFLSLVDPTYGQALITGISGLYTTAVNMITNLGAEFPITFSPSSLIFPSIISLFSNFLYFLLCGICFKKNKIVGAFAILFGLSMVSSLLMGLLVPQYVQNFSGDVPDEQMLRWVVNWVNGSIIFSCLLTAGLAWGVWRRIKTIQH